MSGWAQLNHKSRATYIIAEDMWVFSRNILPGKIHSWLMYAEFHMMPKSQKSDFLECWWRRDCMNKTLQIKNTGLQDGSSRCTFTSSIWVTFPFCRGSNSAVGGADIILCTNKMKWIKLIYSNTLLLPWTCSIWTKAIIKRGHIICLPHGTFLFKYKHNTAWLFTGECTNVGTLGQTVHFTGSLSE